MLGGVEKRGGKEIHIRKSMCQCWFLNSGAAMENCYQQPKNAATRPSVKKEIKVIHKYWYVLLQ